MASSEAGNAVACVVCLISAGLANGLTQGFLSLDHMELNIKREAGTAIEKKQAKTLLPAIERHHLLLVSLLLWNAGANEALPIFMDELVPPFAAIILSITLVLFVGEILPAALMTGSYQLWITYYLAPMVYVVMIVFWPLAFPIAWVLDHTLGEEEGVKTFNKTELETVLRIQQEEASKKKSATNGEAHVDEDDEEAQDLQELDVGLMAGVLRFGDISVSQVMNANVFMLSMDDVLNKKTFRKVFKAGYSRFPVYDQTDIKGIVSVKDLLCINQDDDVPMKTFFELFGRPVEVVSSDQPLDEVMTIFQSRGGHIAVVKQAGDDGELAEDSTIVGIITLEDLLGNIMGKSISGSTLDDGENKVKKNRDVEMANLQMLNHTIHGTKNLSPEEITTITSYLRVSVPEIVSATADDAAKIEQMVRDSLVVEAKRSAADSKSFLPQDQIYKRGKVSDTVTLILNGKVQLLVGHDEFGVELGPWNTLGKEVFQMDEHTYMPDFSAYILTPEVRYLKMTKPGSATAVAVKKMHKALALSTALGKTGKQKSGILGLMRAAIDKDVADGESAAGRSLNDSFTSFPKITAAPRLVFKASKIKIDDFKQAIQKVAAEKRAGGSDGTGIDEHPLFSTV